MSNVLVIGDGPLAQELFELIRRNGHENVNIYLFENESGPHVNFYDYLDKNAEQIARADLVIEAVIHSRTRKKRILKEFSRSLNPRAIVLSTTLNASATEATEWFEGTGGTCLVGWASIFPSEASKVIEVVPGLTSKPEYIDMTVQFFTSLGKEPVVIKDCVGGVLPRVVASLINNAAYALMEGVASAADIDAAMKLGTNYPFGPLEWADKIGLDQVLGILEALCETYGQDRYRPALILRQLVFAGHWGKRTGRGFYEYP